MYIYSILNLKILDKTHGHFQAMNTSHQQAYKICLEMLQQRGYDTSIECNEDINSDTIMAYKDGVPIVVCFISDPKFGIAALKNMLANLKEMSNDPPINHVIAVYKDSITPFTKKTIDNIMDKRIELFQEIDLQYNITKHVLQPKSFEKLSDKDAEAFKKTYGINFPVLKASGSISSFYGYRKGDVIRIVRKSGLVTYRIVK
jgi:DNA-directed RNA polymerase subunit H (RpoH/RPB5)